jgi:hypothetical protein
MTDSFKVNKIDWEEMTDNEVAENIAAGLAEGDKRIARMQEAMRYTHPKPGPGRPPKNGTTMERAAD